jgi:pimeloyl-ACP methyl ester carboxylesterase
MTWLWVAGIAVVVILLGLGLWLWYRTWLRRVTLRASSDSQIVDTALGRVEYGVRGDGPVVLHFHGGSVGHGGWFFLEHLVKAGYRVLTPDRPGYLGTPIENGGTPERQADLAAALLDTLGIDRVAVVGLSAGGPGAIQFAVRHADRVDALVLLSAISQRRASRRSRPAVRWGASS